MADPAVRAGPRSPGGGHRPDVQGLRAFAILAVVAYHAGLPGIRGGFVGVDFFFVLSGFLITGLLIGEHTRHGRISLRAFWARRARRLLPASTVVLVATAFTCGAWLPLLDRPAVATDIGWATVFAANWRFAAQQTDYLASDRAASPVLHYWSLGVEEQFYIVAPVLIVAVAALLGLRALRPPPPSGGPWAAERYRENRPKRWARARGAERLTEPAAATPDGSVYPVADSARH